MSLENQDSSGLLNANGSATLVSSSSGTPTKKQSAYVQESLKRRQIFPASSAKKSKNTASMNGAGVQPSPAAGRNYLKISRKLVFRI